MRKNVDYYLELIGNYDPLTTDQHSHMDAYVRRAVIARCGSFALPASSIELQSSSSIVHTTEFAPRGMIAFLRMFLQPAMAFASIAAIAIGVGVFQLATQDDGGRVPTISMSEPVARPAVVADVLPGSGSALSVFSVAQNTTPAQVIPAASTTPNKAGGKTWRKPKVLNPAAGVFTNWGTSVFSKEEIMRQQAKELAVFSG